MSQPRCYNCGSDKVIRVGPPFWADCFFYGPDSTASLQPCNDCGHAELIEDQKEDNLETPLEQMFYRVRGFLTKTEREALITMIAREHGLGEAELALLAPVNDDNDSGGGASDLEALACRVASLEETVDMLVHGGRDQRIRRIESKIRAIDGAQGRVADALSLIHEATE